MLKILFAKPIIYEIWIMLNLSWNASMLDLILLIWLDVISLCNEPQFSVSVFTSAQCCIGASEISVVVNFHLSVRFRLPLFVTINFRQNRVNFRGQHNFTHTFVRCLVKHKLTRSSRWDSSLRGFFAPRASEICLLFLLFLSFS